MITQFFSRARRAFSLVEVVVAVGIFAFVIIAVIGLLLPNTKLVDEKIEGDVARRLAQNIQSELQRYAQTVAENQKRGSNAGEGLVDFDNLFYNGAPAGRTNSIYLVATKDGSRVLVTGEDPYRAWADTYSRSYRPENALYNTVALSERLAAENALSTATVPVNPAGIAFRDRYYLIEVYMLKNPAHRKTEVANKVALPFIPLGVRIVWPYRLPNGPISDPEASTFDDVANLPWLVVPPSRHLVYTFNTALTP